MPNAQYWIDKLKLEPHPEGGLFRQTYQAPLVIRQTSLPGVFRGPRHASTAIFFLLAGKDFSALHRLAADEIWHFYAGHTLVIHIIDPAGNHSAMKLGQNPEAGEQFQCVVPAGHWFGCCLDQISEYALVGCTVAPGFDFADFELAERARLIAEYPQYHDLITALTRV